MNNLFKMERYQLLHNKVYWGGIVGVFLLGFMTADTYLEEVLGPAGGAASSLSDIFNGMVYDSTFLMVLVCSLLALLLGQEFSRRTVSQEVCAGHPRWQIFVSKVVSYLVVFNLMALVYPVAGCVREYARFGIADAGEFLYNAGKGTVYSLLMNSAVLLIAVLCCFWLRNSAKAVAFTAGITFVLSLYLGYGMMLGLPVAFLPTFQIREAVSSTSFVLPVALVTGIAWIAALAACTWRVFYKCELK